MPVPLDGNMKMEKFAISKYTPLLNNKKIDYIHNFCLVVHSLETITKDFLLHHIKKKDIVNNKNS